MKTKIITIAHQKGGVGKSTIAINLAVELNKKFDVTIIDLDYQKSISIFNETRKNNNLNSLNIKYINNKQELINIFKTTKGIILIDSGGFDSDLNRIALAASDFIITPLSDSLIEIYGLEVFKNILKDLKNINHNIKAHILLNNVNPQAKKTINELKEYIQKNNENFELLNTIIRRRVAFAKSFETGKSVVELDKKSKAAQEINQLINEIINHIL